MDNILVCKRENNSKRSYVLVNKNQGKHYPIESDKVYGEVEKLYENLVKKYPESINKLPKIVLGFAETATGIGAIFSTYFMNSESWYITTTREDVSEQDYVDFSEEHSHATEQRLYYEDMKEVYDKDFEMYFVEDEITTGNTIRNMLVEMYSKGLLKNCKCIYVNSLLNGMNDLDFDKFIEVSEKINVTIKTNWNEKIGPKSEYMEIGKNLEITPQRTSNYDMGDMVRMQSAYLAYTYDGNVDCEVRTGVKVEVYNDNLNRELFKVISDIKTRGLVENGYHVRVIGTEECMYPAIRLSKALSTIWDKLDIKTHSTTRSPIEAGSKDDGSYYGLTSRFLCHSLYEASRKTYLYNSLEQDMGADLVIFVTDSKRGEVQSLGLTDLVAFYTRYCKAKNTYIIRI